MGKKIAILFGISKYSQGNDLPACERDLDVVFAIITASNKFDDSLFINKSPTSSEAKEKIASFIRKHQDEDESIDEVFLYYTGHGMRYEEDFLYLFSDFDSKKKEQTSLRNSELDTMLKSLNPGLTVKIVDACQAGTEYIKSSDDLKVIFEKSIDHGFNKIYFLFSSSKEESSYALRDYSVFTKSFARSLLRYEGKDIRYRDVMAYISDDPSVKEHQTPLFIQQANNTEIFCLISPEIVSEVKSRLESLNNIEDKEPNSEDAEVVSSQDAEDKLIAVIKQRSEKFCNEEEAQNSLSHLVSQIMSHEWSKLILELYSIEPEKHSHIFDLKSVKDIAKWIDRSDEPYFVRMEYSEEAYQGEKKVEIQPADIFGIGQRFNEKRIEYQPIAIYRDVLSSYTVTAPNPCEAIEITLNPKVEALPWLKMQFAFVFSKSKLTIFFKHETAKEINWDSQEVEDKNKWKISSCNLKNLDSITNMVRNALIGMEEQVLEIIKSQADIG